MSMSDVRMTGLRPEHAGVARQLWWDQLALLRGSE